MRRIEEKMVAAFKENRNWSESNTSVVCANGITSVYLFGNRIARKQNGKTKFSKCGWNSATTASRLRALGCKCQIKKGILEMA